MKFRTMSPNGMPGSDIEADNIEAAAIIAEKWPFLYDVIDFIDDTIVIADEEPWGPWTSVLAALRGKTP